MWDSSFFHASPEKEATECLGEATKQQTWTEFLNNGILKVSRIQLLWNTWISKKGTVHDILLQQLAYWMPEPWFIGLICACSVKKKYEKQVRSYCEGCTSVNMINLTVQYTWRCILLYFQSIKLKKQEIALKQQLFLWVWVLLRGIFLSRKVLWCST